jgi:hypothetical protein
VLLLEAHERRAWMALGYQKWEDYVRCEFDLSRPRSYELLDHGRLVRSIRGATGLSDVSYITPNTVRRLKPHLGEFSRLLSLRAAAAAADQMDEVVRELVDSCLPLGASSTTPRLARSGESASSDGQAVVPKQDRIDARAIVRAIGYLAKLPAAPLVAAEMRISGVVTAGLAPALEWLTQLSEELRL